MLNAIPIASTEPALPPSSGSSAGSGAAAAPGFAQALQRQSAQQPGKGRGDGTAAPPAGGARLPARGVPAQPQGPHAPGRGAGRGSAAGLPDLATLATVAPAEPGLAAVAAEGKPTQRDGPAALPAADATGDATGDAADGGAMPVPAELLAWIFNLPLPGTAVACGPAPVRAAAGDAAVDAAAGEAAGIVAADGVSRGGTATLAGQSGAMAGAVSDLSQGGAMDAAPPPQARADQTLDPRAGAAAASSASTQAAPAALVDDERSAALETGAPVPPTKPSSDEASAAVAAWPPQPGTMASELPQGAVGRCDGASDSATPVALAAAPAAPASSSTPQVPAALHAELRERVGSELFAPALAARLAVLVRDGIEHAQLRLNPAEMGPIDVRIRLDGTQAQVDFSAAHAHTRQVLQDAVPVLAGALREAGLTLAGGGVFEQPRDAQAPPQHDAPARADGRQGQTDAPALAKPAAAAHGARARGVVDLYA